MAKAVTCPHCQGACAVDEAHLGKALKCPRCSKVFTPSAAPAAAAEAPRPQTARKRPPLVVERESAVDRQRSRAASETPYEKYALIGVLVVVGGLIIAMLMGVGGPKGGPISIQKTKEQFENDPETRRKMEAYEAQKRYMEGQEQTPGAKRSYEREQKKAAGGN